MAPKRTRRSESRLHKGSRSGARQSSKPERIQVKASAIRPVNLKGLSASQLQDYETALAALAAGRRGYAFGFDAQGQFSRIPVRGVRHAARVVGIPFRKVERYVGSALVRDGKGRIQVTSADRLPRRMLMPTALGDHPIVVRGSRKASLLAKYRRAFLTGDESALGKFAGKRVAGYELVTDIRTVQAILDAGAVDPVETYAPALSGGSR
jgi:hypothetical protein